MSHWLIMTWTASRIIVSISLKVKFFDILAANQIFTWDHLDLTVSAPPINTRTSQDQYEAALFLLPKVGSQANGLLRYDVIEVPKPERAAHSADRQRGISTYVLAELWLHSFHGFQCPARQEGISTERRHVCTHWSLLMVLTSTDQCQDQACDTLPVYGSLFHQDSICRWETWKFSLLQMINQMKKNKMDHEKWCVPNDQGGGASSWSR